MGGWVSAPPPPWGGVGHLSVCGYAKILGGWVPELTPPPPRVAKQNPGWGPPRWQGLCSYLAHLWATSYLVPHFFSFALRVCNGVVQAKLCGRHRGMHGENGHNESRGHA